MKIILFLITISLLISNYVVIAFAEDVKFQFNVSGQTCRHIHITDVNGKVLAVITESSLMSPVEESDTDLIKAVKKYIQDNNLSLVNFKKIKTTVTLNTVAIE